MSHCISIEDTPLRKFERNEPYFAAHWMLGRLVSEDLLNKIKLSVYIRNMHKQHGNCWSYEKSPLEYTIVIKSALGRRDSLRALAHESTHVMQYATGKMQDMWGQHRGKVMWKDRLMENEIRGSAYYNCPWEKEANAMQEKLLQAYLAHIKKLTF